VELNATFFKWKARFGDCELCGPLPHRFNNASPVGHGDTPDVLRIGGA
jgi:hypothetical protein